MKKNIKQRLDGKDKLVKLTKQLEKDIRFFCRDKGIESESELIRQAIGKYIYADFEDLTLKLQGLKQNKELLTEIRDMIHVLFNYIRLMHVNTLAYHPDLGLENADAAFSSAKFRHEKFFNVFQDSLKNEPPMFERLLHKYYSQDNG